MDKTDSVNDHLIAIRVQTREGARAYYDKHCLECDDPRVHQAFVSDNPSNLMNVPEKYRTETLYVIAVSQLISMFYLTPEALKSESFHLQVIEKLMDENTDLYLQMIHDQLTQTICERAVTEYPQSLKYVPFKLKTPEMCMLAVERNGRTLEFVPEHLITERMCMLSLGQEAMNLQFVPETMVTEEMAWEQIKLQGHTIRFIPDKFRTIDMYVEGMSNALIFEHIEECWAYHPQVLQALFDHHSDALWCLPHDTFKCVIEEDLNIALNILRLCDEFSHSMAKCNLINTLYITLTEKQDFSSEEMDRYDEIFEHLDRLNFGESKAHRKYIEMKSIRLKENEQLKVLQSGNLSL